MNNTNTSGNVFNPFTKTNATPTTTSGGIKGFMESNSLVTKVVFLLIVVFIFVILLRLGTNLIAWFLLPSGSPHLIDGMVDGKHMMVIPQTPGLSNTIQIDRSENATEGIEFTWSVWIYIDDLQYLSGKYRHIFHKGNNDLNEESGLNLPNNAPGLYLAPDKNALVIFMNTYNEINETIEINDIPINKWVNVIIKVEDKKMNVYVNGVIARSMKLTGVPKQNYGDVFVAMNGGFSGYISNLWYYDYALGVGEIQSITANGPSLTYSGQTPIQQKDPDYLSLRWYFYGAGDQFNPTQQY